MSARNWKQGTVVVLGVVGLALPALAQRESFEGARYELLGRTEKQLEELAVWCHDQRLYLERDRCYEALIAIDPEHAQARKFLRYHKTARDGWEQQGYKAPKNRAEEPLAELGRRRAELEAGFRTELAALAERFDLAGAERTSLQDDILLLVPDDIEVRARRGEVRGPQGAWILAETAAALERRPDLEAHAEILRGASVPIESDAALEDSQSWRSALHSAHARLRGSCDAKESKKLLRHTETAVTLFELAFGEAPTLPDNYTIYVLGDSRSREEFLAEHPQAEASLQMLEHGFSSVWTADRSTLVVSSEDPEGRLGHTSRQTIQRMLAETFGISPSQGWAYEGFGLALAELVTGSPEVARNTGVFAGHWVWGDEKTLWTAASALVRSGKAPALQSLLSEDIAAFTREDVLLAYAFARYLLEGQGASAGKLLGACGYDMRPAAVVLEEVLGRDLATVEARFTRWVTDLSPSPALQCASAGAPAEAPASALEPISQE